MKTARALAPAASGETSAQARVDLKLVAKGAEGKMREYTPHLLKMSGSRPASIKNAPHLAVPLYGEIPFAGKTYAIAVDEPEGQQAKLYFDANGNGDLADDPPVKWETKPYKGPNDIALGQSLGEVRVPLKVGGKSEPVALTVYRFDKNDPQRQAVKEMLIYFADYFYEGDITLGGKTYRAMLADDTASGDVLGKPAKPKPREADKDKSGEDDGGSRLMIDVNGDGKFSIRGETFATNKPFNIRGTTWALAPAGGDSDVPVKVVASREKVDEVSPPPDHRVGHKVTAFTATRTDGKTVNFPGDYKGKLVLLDFWATWCPPCMAELDGLVATHKEYQPRGVEFLGVSLDDAESESKVKTVTTVKGMTWPQVFEGKGWESAVPVKYGIEALPAPMLIDGDTGEILADGKALLGGALPETLKKALEKKTGAHAAG